jgi:hypothetical protein
MPHVFNVHCMMCGRAAGYVRNGVFTKLPNVPPPVVLKGRSRCGTCGGNVYLEAEDSPFSPPVESIVEHRARRAS